MCIRDRDKRAGEDAGRGSGTPSDSDAIPLESDDTELNRELDEINSLGVSKEAEYTQASFFFRPEWAGKHWHHSY